MRQLAAVLAAALSLAACGEKDEPDVTRAAGGGKAAKGQRSLTGCLELWNGPHVGSTRLQYVAQRHTTYAKVQVKDGRCVVAFASEDAEVYGRYVEKDNAAGPWTLDAERAEARVARKVVRTANATGHEDGTLTPGAP